MISKSIKLIKHQFAGYLSYYFSTIWIYLCKAEISYSRLMMSYGVQDSINAAGYQYFIITYVPYILRLDEFVYLKNVRAEPDVLLIFMID